jgi:hypothetical protein
MRARLTATLAAFSTLSTLTAVTISGSQLAATAQAAAALPPPVAGQFTLSPAVGGDGQPRAYFKLSVRPGRSATDVVVFGNGGAAPEKLRVGVTEGITAANSGAAYGALATDCTGPACWVAGLPRIITLPPHTQEAVTFRVSVPAGTRPAQYLAGITAMPVQASRPERISTNGHASTQVIVLSRVVIGIAVTVGELAELHTKTEISGVSAAWIDGLVRLTARVHNSGQRFAKGNGTLNCAPGALGAANHAPAKNPAGTHSFRLFMDTVLPGQGAGLPVNATGLGPGTWQCAAHISLATGGSTAWAGSVTVPSAVPAATRRIASNVYVVPSGGIPGWAIALLVLGVLLLLSLWAVLLRWSRSAR